MKILAIRGKNLASLEGDFAIDFTVDPLRTAGIFAITGQTGAGKSTLLDALCLALFDETPRNNGTTENINIVDVKDKTINQKDSRNILRRGAIDGYAEVDFVSLGGEKFRSRWSVRRSRDKVDGSLQTTNIVLINLITNFEVQGRKTELLTKISELIGLTFEQFTRSVLLAQGDFATFLRATQREKAELLEKLTGTDIYSIISIAVYEKSKQAEQEFYWIKERIKDIALLSDEDFHILTHEKTVIDRTIEEVKNIIQTLNIKIKWITDQEILKKNIDEATQSLLHTEKNIEEAKPRYDYLFQIDGVQEIRDIFVELKRCRTQFIDSNTELLKQAEERKTTFLLQKQWQEKVVFCEEEISKQREIIKEILPQIKQARALDVRMIEARNNVLEVKKEYDSVTFDRNNVETNIQKKEKLLITQKKLLQTLEQQQIELQSVIPTEVITLREKLEEGKPCSVCGSTIHPYREINSTAVGLNIKEIARRWKENLEQHTAIKQTIDNCQGELVALHEHHSIVHQQFKTKEAHYYRIIGEVELLQRSRAEFFGGISADDVEKKHANQDKIVHENLEKARVILNEMIAKGEKQAGIITKITDDISDLKLRCTTLENTLNEWIASKNGTVSLEQLESLLAKSFTWITSEKEALNRLHQLKTAAKATLAERNKNLDIHNNAAVKAAEQENKEVLQVIIEEKNLVLQHQTARNIEIEKLIVEHNNGKERLLKFGKELKEKEALSHHWKKLNELFGSADGAKFKVLAQGYTLDILLGYANKHLNELSKRYELQRIADTLALQVIDLDMFREVRSVHSLSGGESFLISLALALGLSSLSSNRMKVESLFIDEGFGALDMDTLRMAVDVLEQLQTQGRKIGVISHVTEMTERISTQINVIKRSNGSSFIEIVG